MECKVWNVVSVEVSVPVLIETLWNVKDFKEKVMEMVQSVLIETLWNVKREKYLI